MLGLEKIIAGAKLRGIAGATKLRGIAGATPIEVMRVEWIGSDALNVVYRGADGPAEVLLYREAEQRLELVQASRAFSFDGDGEAFRVASEAQRIRLAHLFDPYLAIHSSRIEPLGRGHLRRDPNSRDPPDRSAVHRRQAKPNREESMP